MFSVLKEKKLISPKLGPDFICIGMQKTGTNWLHEQLSSNSSFWVPPIKELHFFDRGFNFKVADRRIPQLLLQTAKQSKEDLRFYARIFQGRASEIQRALAFNHQQDRAENGIKGLELSSDNVRWYKSLFKDCPPGKLCGDITPGYSTLSGSEITYLKGYFPDISVVLGIRDPVKRFWSQVNQSLRRNCANGEMEIPSTETIREWLKRENFHKRSYPSRIYLNWAQEFNPKLLKVYIFEEIQKNPVKVRSEIATFLGAKDSYFSLDPHFNGKLDNKRLEIPENVRDFLESHFYKEKCECRKLFPEVIDFWEFN